MRFSAAVIWEMKFESTRADVEGDVVKALVGKRVGSVGVGRVAGREARRAERRVLVRNDIFQALD